MSELNLVWLTRILLIPAALLGLALVGIVTIFNLNIFSLAVIGYSCGVYFLMQRVQKTAIPKIPLTADGAQKKLLNIVIIGLGHIFNWSALLFSKRDLAPSNIYQSIEKAGFPFTAFYYPQPPMGGDIPPLHMWFPFFLNLLLWTIASYFLVHYFNQASIIKHRKICILLSASSLIITLAGLGYIAMKFD